MADALKLIAAPLIVAALVGVWIYSSTRASQADLYRVEVKVVVPRFMVSFARQMEQSSRLRHGRFLIPVASTTSVAMSWKMMR